MAKYDRSKTVKAKWQGEEWETGSARTAVVTGPTPFLSLFGRTAADEVCDWLPGAVFCGWN